MYIFTDNCNILNQINVQNITFEVLKFYWVFSNNKILQHEIRL
jgi:hypothetical protein